MDITPASVVSQQMATTQTEVQNAVLRKVLDMESQQGSDLARLIQQAAGLGRGVDFQA
jgi:hypothetical protein